MNIAAYLPQLHGGYLPAWLLLTSLISVANSYECYTNISFPRRVYTGTVSPSTSPTPTPSPSTSPVTPLSARTFGTWTFLSSIIRFYAAYNISDPLIYQLALWAYALAFAHFASEWLGFGTARMGPGLGSTIAVSSMSLVWMVTQWGWYVQ